VTVIVQCAPPANLEAQVFVGNAKSPLGRIELIVTDPEPMFVSVTLFAVLVVPSG